MHFWLRQFVFALLHAGCVLFGLSPFDVWPASFGAIFFVLWASEEQREKSFLKILSAGILFALALTLVTFGWIIATIHRYTGEHFALTFLLTLLYAFAFQTKAFLFFLLRHFFFRAETKGVAAGLAVAASLALIDALSPELFPWSWGNTLAGEPHFRQLAATGSVYLVSFAAGFGGWLFFQVFVFARKRELRQHAKSILTGFAALFLFFVIGVLGRYAPDVRGKVELLSVLITQTNIGAAPESKRNDTDFAADAINRLFNQSIEGMMLKGIPDLVIWPEASMPFHAATRMGENQKIYSPTLDGVLTYIGGISGASVVFQDIHQTQGTLYSRFSSRPEAEGTQTYFKRRLVPWGEYLPFEKIWGGARRVFPDAGKFSPGTSTAELSVPYSSAKGRPPILAQLQADLPLLSMPEKISRRYPRAPVDRRVSVKPLLCYEALYPSDARTADADLIINLSSDAWFGDGIEGHQHAGAAMLRAVENGIPMVRGAMSGVSVIVDSIGDLIVPPTGQGRAETLYAEIPLKKKKTIFSRFGMAAFYCLMFAAAWPYLLMRFRFFRRQESR